MLTKRVLAVGLTGVEGASSVPLIALGYPALLQLLCGFRLAS
jgi:hypothetical protein